MNYLHIQKGFPFKILKTILDMTIKVKKLTVYTRL